MSLIDLGEDILVSNVARYLRPIDILHLSMTCKDMRSNFETNDAYHMLYSKIFGSKPTPLSIENYDWKHLFHLRTSRAKLYTWGSPEQGRLGYLVNEIPPDHVITNGFRKGVCLPTNVVPFNQLVVSDISAGGFSFQILTNDGDLYYTGGRWKRLQSLGQLTPGPVNGRDYNPSMGSGSLYFPTPLPSLLQARARRMVGPGVAPPPDMARRYGREMNNRASMERTADSDNLTRPPEAQPALSKRVPIDAKFVTKLDLPDVLDGQSIEARSIISVSSGREHFIALDNQNGIYSWDTGNTTNIGVRITFPGIDPRKQITKISCGWNLSACHIKGVGIVVWYAREAVSEDSFEAKKLLAPARYVVIPGTNEYTPRDFLAGLDYVLIIDNDGKLLRFDIHAQSYANGSIDPSLAAKPFFVNSFNTWAEKKSEAGQAPTFTKLSGCYNLFAIFASDGLVVIGNKTITAADNEDGEPVVIPELQGRGVIDMAMGDYHYLALTDRGELLTWGRESSLCGCLGLGSKETFLSEHPEASGDSGSDIVANKPVVVKKPEEKGEWLAIAAAGWHSGARIMTTLSPFADPNQRESEANSSAGVLTPSTSHHGAHTVTRSRRSSSIIQHLEPDTLDTKIDQALNPNVNASWVNFKGAWVIHIVLILFLKILFNFITVLDNDWKWTLTNLTYNIGSYIMFHQVKGTPFEFNSGAYDNLTLWEQIDNGDQYTPTKKFLMTVPIGLFLVSTHYSNYNLNLFILNGVSCLCVVVPKLAISHRLRVTLY